MSETLQPAKLMARQLPCSWSFPKMSSVFLFSYGFLLLPSDPGLATHAPLHLSSFSALSALSHCHSGTSPGQSPAVDLSDCSFLFPSVHSILGLLTPAGENYVQIGIKCIVVNLMWILRLQGFLLCFPGLLALILQTIYFIFFPLVSYFYHVPSLLHHRPASQRNTSRIDLNSHSCRVHLNTMSLPLPSLPVTV